MILTYKSFDHWLIEHALSLPVIYCEDILTPPNPPPEPPERKGKKLVCEACDCTLAADGGVLVVSPKWKKLREAERSIADLERANNDLQGRLETAQHDLETIRAPRPEPSEPTNPPGGDGSRPVSGFHY